MGKSTFVILYPKTWFVSVSYLTFGHADEVTGLERWNGLSERRRVRQTFRRVHNTSGLSRRSLLDYTLNYAVSILVKQQRFWKILKFACKGWAAAYRYPHWRSGRVCGPHTAGLHRPPAFWPASRGQRWDRSLSLTCAGLRYSYSAPHLCMTHKYIRYYISSGCDLVWHENITQSKTTFLGV